MDINVLTEKPRSVMLADKLHENQSKQRELAAEEGILKGELALALLEEGMTGVMGGYGQKYELTRPNARYVFNIPDEEYDRLGIRDVCTPPAKPKLTKILVDKLLKQRSLDDSTVAEWQVKGWYVIDRSDEITIKQVTTKLEELQETVGF